MLKESRLHKQKATIIMHRYRTGTVPRYLSTQVFRNFNIITLVDIKYLCLLVHHQKGDTYNLL